MDYPLKNSIHKCEDGSTKPNSSNILLINETAYDEVMRTLQALLDRDYAKNTKDALLRDIREFLLWYQTESGESFVFNRIIERDVIDFRDSLKRLERAPASINRKIVSIRMFLETALELGYLTKNPSKKVKPLVTQELAPKSLTKQQTRKFLKEVEIRGSERDIALVNIMLLAGLRVSEVSRLTIEDIVIGERSGFVQILNSKGGKSRKVPLVQQLRSILATFLQTRHIKYEKFGSSSKVFLGQRGPLTEIAINKIFEKYSKISGAYVHPHSLRHTFAYRYLELNPGDIVGLSQLMGHSDINTTAIYTQNRLEDLHHKMQGFEE